MKQHTIIATDLSELGPLTLTVQQLAKLLNVSQVYVRALIRRGKLPFPVLRLGRRVLFRTKDVMAWLEGGLQEPAGK